MEHEINASSSTFLRQERQEFGLPAASRLTKDILQLAARGFVADTARCRGVMQGHSLREQTGEQSLTVGQTIKLLQNFRFKRAPGGRITNEEDRSLRTG